LKEILSANYVFQGGDRLCLFQKAYAAKLKKHMYVLKDKHLSYNLDHAAHSFSVLMELAFVVNPSTT
jgi:hypothetical protein